jgi:hypothetical protein
MDRSTLVEISEERNSLGHTAPGEPHPAFIDLAAAKTTVDLIA